MVTKEMSTQVKKRHTISKILSILLSICLLCSLVPLTASATSGYWTYYAEPVTPDGTTYTINTAAELAWIAEQVNNGNDFSGYTVALNSNINMGGHYWIPIGISSSNCFSGTFDGCGKTIYSMNFTANTSSYYGLFGYSNGAAFSNVNFRDCSIHVTNNQNIYAGILSGYMCESTCTNCSANCSINITALKGGGNQAGGAYAGLLFGCVYPKSAITSTITNCYTAGGASATGNYDAYVGGLVGFFKGGTINNCYSTATASANHTASTGTVAAGGLIGENYGSSINNCYSTGYVTGSNALYRNGLIGYNATSTSTITNCYWRTASGTGYGIGGNPATSLTALYISQLKSTEVIGSGTYATSTLIEALNDAAGSISNSASWQNVSALNSGYPVFTYALCTITYDGNGSTGGTTPVDDSYYMRGSFATVQGNTGNLEKTGYTFSGWNTAADGSGQSSDIMLSPNTTLYAQWAANEYTVNFDENGGSEVADVTQSYNSTINSMPTSVKAGYTLEGWYSDEALTNKVTFPYTITGNTTLYANWAVTSYYQITYNGNGNTAGNEPLDSTAYVLGDSAIVADNTGNLEKTGYTFSEWNTAADGSGISYTAGDTLIIENNMTLYAQWDNLWTSHITAISPVNDTYTVTNAQELAWISYEANNGNAFSGYTIELANDIDLSGHNWVPIGNSSTHYFAGTFEGNNHSIDNLQSSEINEYTGLFGNVDGATIQNLNISVSIDTAASDSNDSYTGGICSIINNGVITNCSISGTISTTGDTLYVGGVAGYVSSSSISSCSSSATITASGSNSIYSGGFIGKTSETTISECSATGSLSISGNADTITASGFIGTQIGGSVTNSTSTGSISFT